jgi:hypothetical protein
MFSRAARNVVQSNSYNQFSNTMAKDVPGYIRNKYGDEMGSLASTAQNVNGRVGDATVALSGVSLAAEAGKMGVDKLAQSGVLMKPGLKGIEEHQLQNGIGGKYQKKRRRTRRPARRRKSTFRRRKNKF